MKKKMKKFTSDEEWRMNDCGKMWAKINITFSPEKTFVKSIQCQLY